MFPILTFEPQLKSVLWGGSRIAPFKGLPPQGDHIGESWELSDVPGHESTVAAGPYKGRKLNELMASHGREIMGSRLTERYGTAFPLLVKFIDSNDDLSVQVHPDDTLAAKRHHCPGKTEMWVSVDPAPGAYLYAGLSRAMTPEEYRRSIEDNTLISSLGKYYTRKDDVFFLPAGRIHSIGRGNFVLEIQETSDITYRIYDYDRRDAEGNPRQLHIEESIEAVDFNDTEGAAPTIIPEGENRETTLVDCHHFTTTAINVRGRYTIDLAPRDSFSIIVATEGSAELVDPEGRSTPLPKGTTALIPATMKAVAIVGDAKIITSYIK